MLEYYSEFPGPDEDHARKNNTKQILQNQC